MEKLKPEGIIRMLKKHGTVVTMEQAIEILMFLRKIAEITVEDFIDKNLKKNKV